MNTEQGRSKRLIRNTNHLNYSALNPECNICKTRESRLIFRKEGFNYFICQRCGLAFIFPKPTQEELRQTYEDLSKNYYVLGFKIEEDFSQTYESILDSMERYRLNNRLLEIGCSTGALLVAARNGGWIPFGTEISRHSAEYGISRHQLNIFTGELTEAHFPSEYFDVILLIQTLEHLPDPDAYIKECHRVLRKGGVLFISVPNFKGITTSFLKKRYFYVQNQHLFYFTPKALKIFLRKRGFQIMELKTVGIDLFNLILGGILNLKTNSKVQRRLMTTNIRLRKKKFMSPVRFIYKLFTFPICYFGRGDGILLYAEKS